MNILHVIPTLDPRAGGPPGIAARLAAGQASLGHVVGVMTYQSDAAGRDRIRAENGRLAGFDRVTVHPLPAVSVREQLFGRDARGEALRLVPDADVVHLHGVWESQLRVTAAVARRVGRPYFVLLNGMLFPWSMRRRRVKKAVALATGVRRMLRGGTLQCGSDDERLAADAVGVAVKTVVLPNGVNASEWVPPAAGSFRASHPALGHDPFALFLGRIHEQKGVDLLVPALLSTPPHVHLVVAGPDFGREGELRRQVIAAGLAGRVVFVGPLYGAAKLGAIADAACFVLPSRMEGFSVAVLESLALGTPVVVSRECHFPELAAAGAGAVTSLDPAEIGRAVARFATDQTARAAASAAARELVLTHYTWDAIARRSIELYREAGGGP